MELAARLPVIEAIGKKLFYLLAYCNDGALLAAIECVKLVSRNMDGGVHARVAANVGGDQGTEPLRSGSFDLCCPL